MDEDLLSRKACWGDGGGGVGPHAFRREGKQPAVPNHLPTPAHACARLRLCTAKKCNHTALRALKWVGGILTRKQSSEGFHPDRT